MQVFNFDRKKVSHFTKQMGSIKMSKVHLLKTTINNNNYSRKSPN